MATDMTVSNTILEQLGGRRFIAMTGSKNLCGGQNSLSFKVGSGTKNRISHVRIVLEANDTYTMTFLSVRGTTIKTVATVSDVYCDMLQDIFTTHTGFYTTM